MTRRIRGLDWAAALVAVWMTLERPAPVATSLAIEPQQVARKLSKDEYLRRLPSKEEAWAEDRRRDRMDQPESIIETIGVKAGMRIGEAGAGGGYFTFFLSRHVGKAGVVYANDNDEYMLFALEHYARAFFGSLGNIVPVLGSDDDPRFPARELDMIVIYGSFHDFTRREEWLRNARPYLRATGRLVIVDGYWPDHGALTKDLIVELSTRAGFRLVSYKDSSREYVEEDGTTKFRSQHVHVFALER